MNWVSILILVLVVVLAIFVLAFVAHDRGSVHVWGVPR